MGWIKKIRLLPVAIFAAGLLLTVKVGGLFDSFNEVIESVSVSESYAQSMPEEPLEANVEARGLVPVEGTEAAGETDLAMSDDNTANVVLADDLFDPMELNATEFALLQDLSARRETLDERGRELDLREKMLLAAERQVDDKIVELKEIEKTIEGLLRQHDEEQSARIDSLVKIYQSMKPKNAARIFAELDLPVLLDVLERMREAKSALILALLDPERAKTLTIELAERGRLPETAGSRF